MLIQIPEHFEKNPNILKLPNLSFLYYFNRELSDTVNVKINKHMLIHIFNGSKIIHKDDKEYTISDKQSAFIAKGQYFMSEILSLEKSSFDGIMVFFDDTFLLSFFAKYPTLINTNPNKEINHNTICIIKESNALHETMLSTQAYIKRATDEDFLIQLKFEEIFLQLLQSNSSNEILKYFEALYTTSLFKLKDLFENNHFKNVQEMLQKSKLPSAQFRKLFNELYNTTPKEWLLKKALLKSKKLLESKKLNVTEVCQECDFNSISWFIKSFKAEFGVTPKKYQQNC